MLLAGDQAVDFCELGRIGDHPLVGRTARICALLFTVALLQGEYHSPFSFGAGQEDTESACGMFGRFYLC